MLLLVMSLGLFGPVGADSPIHFKEEKHFKSVQQLTFSGTNAEAYFSFDNSKLTYQAMGGDYKTDCDQIYQLDLNSPDAIPRRMSTGLGVCTCSYFLKDNKHSLYAGTFWNAKYPSGDNGNTCPVKACDLPNKPAELEQLCNSHGYFWNIFEDYDIFVVNEFGTVVQRLTEQPGYDAEAVLNPTGDKILFTSRRKLNGDEFADLELYIMDVDGSNVTRLTNQLGYDGGGFFSPDGKKAVFRASRPKTPEAVTRYKTLLKYGMVEPLEMEIYTIDLQTRNITQVTKLGGANWAPYYHNDNKRIIFSSDHRYANDSRGFGAFGLWIVNEDGSGLEQVTYGNDVFDAFPMFSFDGKYLAFGSSRNATEKRDVNIFLAEWIDPNSSMAATWSSLVVLLALMTMYC